MTDHDHDHDDSAGIDARLRAAVADVSADVPDTNAAEVLDGARSARDHAARRRRRRVRGVTLGAAAAVVLIVVGVAFALQQDSTPTRVAGPQPAGTSTLADSEEPGSGSVAGSASDPGAGMIPGTNTTTTPSLPIPPEDAHERCPDTPAPVPFGSGQPSAGPLLDFTPTEVIVCNYDATSTTGGYVLADPAKLSRIESELNALGPASPDRECTAEAGPTVAVIAADGSRTETIWLQLYGCGNVFTDDQLRTGAKSLDWLSG